LNHLSAELVYAKIHDNMLPDLAEGIKKHLGE